MKSDVLNQQAKAILTAQLGEAQRQAVRLELARSFLAAMLAGPQSIPHPDPVRQRAKVDLLIDQSLAWADELMARAARPRNDTKAARVVDYSPIADPDAAVGG